MVLIRRDCEASIGNSSNCDTLVMGFVGSPKSIERARCGICEGCSPELNGLSFRL